MSVREMTDKKPQDIYGILHCPSSILTKKLIVSLGISENVLNSLPGYFIQFCIIACFLWLTVMWIDICVHAWHYLPKGIKQTPQDDNIHLMYYSLFTFGVSLILVILTYKNNLSGLPSYYIKGTTKGA
jgi:hypothetical protein